MTINDLIIQIMSGAFNITLPVVGVSFGIFCVFIWTLPMLVRFIKSLF